MSSRCQPADVHLNHLYTLLSGLRTVIRKNLFLRKLVGYYLASSGLFDWYFRSYSVSPFWARRIQNVMSGPDNEFIPRVPKAGLIESGIQFMHNGLRIRLGSYYGPEYGVMLLKNRGVHEPQEERVFQEVLKFMRPGAVMFEMGSFWSFYSMWFQQRVPDAVNYMFEPDAFNLGQGKRNFDLNGMRGTFVQALIGQSSGTQDGTRTIGVDDFMRENGITCVDMLHSDIQGFELDMLKGAMESLQARKIGYVFLSTHSNELHTACEEFLRSVDYVVIASANMDESFSEDGFLAARNPSWTGLGPVSISKKENRVTA